MPFALHIHSDDPGTWRWTLLSLDHEVASEHSAAACDFATYADALNAGTVALAAADGQPYENEAADPVGYADCA
jgi:hypothetical protein